MNSLLSSRLRWAACLAVLLLTSPGWAQTDPANFTSVINVPPDVAPNEIGSDTQLNLLAGGSLPPYFVAGSFDGSGTNIEVNLYAGDPVQQLEALGGSTVNVLGEAAIEHLNASQGSMVNLTGGGVTEAFDGAPGSVTRITGGNHGENFFFQGGSAVEIVGGDFRINGGLLSELDTPDATLAISSLSGHLSGVLSDGTPFAFFNSSFGTDTLTLVADPPPTPSPTVVTLPDDPTPKGLRSGQTLIVNSGGGVPDRFNIEWGGAATINDGVVGDNFEAVGATVTVAGGVIGRDFRLYASTLHITGGTIGENLSLSTATDAFISGGTIGDGFGVSSSGVDVDLAGGEFLLDGQPVPGLDTPGSTVPLNIPTGSVLSGVLADGSTFAFARWNDEVFLPDGVLTLTAAAPPAAGPALISLPTDPIPKGLRTGQTLIVEQGATIGDNFTAGWGSTVEINGGEVGDNFQAVGANVTINGGAVGRGLDAMRGSVVEIAGGTVDFSTAVHNGGHLIVSGGSLQAFTEVYSGGLLEVSGGSIAGNVLMDKASHLIVTGGEIGSVNVAGAQRFGVTGASTAHVSGGVIGANSRVFNEGVLTVIGGEIGASLRVNVGGTANLAGGEIGEALKVEHSGTVNLFGSDFALAGVPLADLNVGESYTITDRDVTLTGFFADGSPFSFDLNSDQPFSEDHFHQNATLTVTLLQQGDYNFDGVVDGGDYAVWRENLGAEGLALFTAGDGNGDGRVTSADYDVWRANFGAVLGGGLGASRVPEPLGALLLMMLCSPAFLRRR